MDRSRPVTGHLWGQLKLFDQALVCFFLLLNVLILVFHENLSLWGWHFLKHCIACLLVVTLVPALQSRKHPACGFIRDWYAATAIPFIYWNMGNFIHLVFPGEFDALIITLETKVFQTLPNIQVQQLVGPVLTEVMQFFYALYWLTIPVGAAVLYFNRRCHEYDYFIYYVALTFLISCVLFILFPVVGPRFFMADQISAKYEGLFLAGFFRRFVEHAGLRGCAFPSAHAAVAAVVTCFMWAVYPRLGKMVFLPALVGLSLATVYGQYHYFSDVFAGLAMGISIGILGVRHMRGMTDNACAP